VTDKDRSLDEEEQDRLESKLRQRGWTYVGYTPSGISALRACIGQGGAGTRVVLQSSTTTRRRP
jgi:hypothetical protein